MAADTEVADSERAATRLVLGIETSCDETAAAVVEQGRIVRSNIVASQAALHAPYGGVFPEVASRQHVRDVVPVVRRALAEADVALGDLDAIAVTRGPGLSGALLVGVNLAKGLALAADRPLVGVNHLHGHVASQWLHVDGALLTPEVVARQGGLHTVSQPPVPHLALVVSGGHTDLAWVRARGDVERLGGTLDDAAGEAFDKAARMLGLGYPGGPAIERAARDGAAARFQLPVAQTPEPLDFSFSGLKTALLRCLDPFGGPVEDGGAELPVEDLSAAFQVAVVRAVIQRLERALEVRPAARAICVSGGVSANGALRRALVELGVRSGRAVWLPPLALCTDNAAMIAAAGAVKPIETSASAWALDVHPGLSIADA